MMRSKRGTNEHFDRGVSTVWTPAQHEAAAEAIYQVAWVGQSRVLAERTWAEVTEESKEVWRRAADAAAAAAERVAMVERENVKPGRADGANAP